MTRFAAWLAAAGVWAASASAENWPAWRGPSGDGRGAAGSPPLTWSATAGVRWKVPLPEPGNSTPVVWGDRIFVTQALQEGRKRGLICFARADGRKLWERFVDFPEVESMHKTNTFCAGSAVADGGRVIACLGAAGLVCWDHEGKELWKVALGRLDHLWGTSSSPLLHGDLCIVQCGPGERQFVPAVDKASGREVWRADIPGGSFGRNGGKDWLGSWATPLIARSAEGREELLITEPKWLKGLDPATGRELWRCGGLGPLVYASPVAADGVAVAMSGFQGPALAVRMGGAGDVTASRRLWHHSGRQPQRIGSPILVEGRVVIVPEPGVPMCFDLQTGAERWNLKERPAGQNWGSPVLAGGRLYVTALDGSTLVMDAGAEFKLLAVNRIGERVLASPVVTDGEILLRSHKHLWCIGKGE
jgi:outer membrane protein assembly factor BamB